MEYTKLSPETAIKMIKFIPRRPDYETWIRVISSIANYYDFNTAVSILKSRFADEKINETEIKIKNRLRSVGIGTFIYYAKKYGYMANKPATNRRSYDLRQKALSNYMNIIKPVTEPEKRIISGCNELLYKFEDEALEMESAVYKVKNQCERFKADLTVSKLHPGAKKERVYRVSVNRSILNKNLCPNTKQKYGFIDRVTNKFVETFTVLNSGFENKFLTLNQMKHVISKGRVIIPAHLKADENGKMQRQNENFLCSELIMLDIDKNNTIDEILAMENKGLILLYTTVNHTAEQHRFRLVFELPFLIKNREDYEYLLNEYICKYSADKQCKDVSRCYYGNNNAIIYDFVSGEVTAYKGGGVC
jgi:hypothetical protein